MIFSTRLKGGQKNGGWKILPFPAILKGFLRLKLQNWAVKSNSEKRFTFAQKNSECAANRQKKIDKNGKNLSFAEFLKNKSELLVFSSMMKYI